MEPAGTPVVFVHGLWLHPTSWGPWVEFFQEAGYAPVAPAGGRRHRRGDAGHPEQVARKGINDVVEHYAGIIRAERPPHRDRAFLRRPDRSAAARAARGRRGRGHRRHPSGRVLPPPSSLRVARLHKRSNREKAVSLTNQFHFGFEPAERRDPGLFDRWAIPSPGKPLFEDAVELHPPHARPWMSTRTAAHCCSPPGV
jgi:hypothetical protein